MGSKLVIINKLKIAYDKMKRDSCIGKELINK